MCYPLIVLDFVYTIHDVTEAHPCKRRNENRVIYHHFVERILTDFMDKKEFLFSYEFPNFMEHSYQFEPLRKNDNFITQNKIAHIVHSLT